MRGFYRQIGLFLLSLRLNSKYFLKFKHRLTLIKIWTLDESRGKYTSYAPKYIPVVTVLYPLWFCNSWCDLLMHKATKYLKGKVTKNLEFGRCCMDKLKNCQNQKRSPPNSRKFDTGKRFSVTSNHFERMMAFAQTFLTSIHHKKDSDF